jgi:hypothetical protein
VFSDAKKDDSLSEDRPSQIDELLMRLILQYLIEHPDAKDTSKGIQKWWLPKAYGDRGRDEVQSALDLLTSRGWLTKRRTIPSKEIYGMSKDRISEIKSFLLSRGSF